MRIHIGTRSYSPAGDIEVTNVPGDGQSSRGVVFAVSDDADPDISWERIVLHAPSGGGALVQAGAQWVYLPTTDRYHGDERLAHALHRWTGLAQ